MTWFRNNNLYDRGYRLGFLHGTSFGAAFFLFVLIIVEII